MVISLTISLGAWALASPVGSDPDGNFHLASIWCGDGYKVGQCEPPSEASKNILPRIVTVPRAVALANGCRPGETAYSASCTNGLLRDLEMVETGYNNAGRLYPNGYYWVASHFVSDNIASAVIKIRLMNILVYVLLVVAVNVLLPREISRSLNMTHLVFLMPMGLFLLASNNPSSWAITGLGTFWAFLYGFLTMKNKKRVISSAFFSVVSAFMAIQARADSAAFVIVVGTVVAVIALIREKQYRPQIYRRLILPVIIFVPAYFTYTSSGQSRAISSGLLGDESYGREPLTTLLWNITRLPGIFAGVFGYSGAGGGLGWLDVAMPEVVSIGMLFLAAYLIAQSMTRRTRLEVITLLGFLGIIGAMPILILQQDGAFVGENFQSRYLLPSLVSLCGLYFSRSTILESHLMTPKVLTSGLLSVAYLVSLHTTIRRYVTGSDVMDWNLNRDREWWWEGVPSPMSVLVVGSLTYTALVGLYIFDSDRSKSTLER